MKPSIAMFAPSTVVTNRGQMGYIMSEPMSFRNEAAANVFIVFLFWFSGMVIILGFFIDKCFARVCVSRVQIPGFRGRLWLIFCVCSCRILFSCGGGVDFFLVFF